MASGLDVARMMTAIKRTMIRKAVRPKAIHFFLLVVVKVVGKKAPWLKELVLWSNGDGEGGGSKDSRPMIKTKKIMLETI